MASWAVSNGPSGSVILSSLAADSEIAARGGRSGLRVHVLPYPLNEKRKEDVLPVGEEHFRQVLQTMGASLAVPEPAE